jgi:A/G-specific adenine glycosylase
MDPAAIVPPITGWYRESARDLPWRASDRTPWGVLVSEIMLQQTQVDRVLPVWRAWLERWPSPSDLAAAPLDEVLRAWGRLGYPRRARWLWQAAQHITAHFDGAVPSDEATLRELPGVGSYTAAAVAAFAFSQPAVVLDTNVRRVLARAVLGQSHPVAHITAAERTLAQSLIPTKDPAQWSIAIMELGALICTARDPQCSKCPIANQCAWRAAGFPEATHERRRAKPYVGSDRQARGTILAILREADHAINADEFQISDPDQRERALQTLIDDGLITQSDNGYALPSGP